jgi:hypothetical protein
MMKAEKKFQNSVKPSALCRVTQLAGQDGNLSKEAFINHLKSSNFFLKSFDKNKDGYVSEVSEDKIGSEDLLVFNFYPLTMESKETRKIQIIITRLHLAAIAINIFYTMTCVTSITCILLYALCSSIIICTCRLYFAHDIICIVS